MHIDGACHCGNITFEAEIDPAKARICHCTDCQQLSGTAFRTVIPCSAENFTLLTGTPKIYLKTAQSGRVRQQAFCPDCGSAIYATSAPDDPSPRVLGLRLGTLRQRAELVPTKQYWTSSAMPWLPEMGSIPRAEEQ